MERFWAPGAGSAIFGLLASFPIELCCSRATSREICRRTCASRRNDSIRQMQCFSHFKPHRKRFNSGQQQFFSPRKSGRNQFKSTNTTCFLFCPLVRGCGWHLSFSWIRCQLCFCERYGEKSIDAPHIRCDDITRIRWTPENKINLVALFIGNRSSRCFGSTVRVSLPKPTEVLEVLRSSTAGRTSSYSHI